MPLDDAEIMRRVQAGEAALFGLLVERYRSALLRVADSKLGNVAWAEDVVQETFLAAYSARGSYKPQFAFRTWLWTILLNLCRRHWQRRESRPQEQSASAIIGWDVADHGEAIHADTGLGQLLLTERRQEVQRLLAALPEPQADALRLRFLAGLPFAEIALTMNSSLSAAKQRVKQGLETLAHRLREQRGDLP
jgi:RNA polymerase sigma-70 factor (ECF subfamily)